MYQQKKQTASQLIPGNTISNQYKAAENVTTPSKSKKKYHWYIIIVILLLLSVIGYWLRPFSTAYFRYPLSVSPELAASFGEVRKDHFHMGLDLRTNGRENLPVYAIADGFISRIQISENGFGKAIYVAHTNETTSVYAHLNRFSSEVEKYVHKQQYQQQEWKQDISFPQSMFPVRKGDFIAYTGNTGTSEGPHLHMELHNTKTGKSLNPQTNNFIVHDNIVPVIKNVFWYNKQNSIYETKGIRLKLTGESPQPVEVNSPRIILGIEAIDKNANNRFQLGIYKAALYMDDILMHRFSLDELSENDTRYVNASIDYKEYITSGKAIQLLSTLPGNRLSLFSKDSENGVLDIHDKQIHRIKIEVNDAAGNTSSINFPIRFNGTNAMHMTYPKNSTLVTANRDTTFQQEQITLHVRKYSLFDNVPIQVTATNTQLANSISQRIDISPSEIPLYDSVEITIPTTLPQDNLLRKRAVMLLQTAAGNVVIKGTWHNHKLTANLPAFGTVQVVIDTIPPSISLDNTRNNHSSQGDVISVICKDNLGRVAAFRGTIDGRWVLFERKGNTFTYQPDEYCKPGTHNLTITASDIAGNTTIATFTITR